MPTNPGKASMRAAPSCLQSVRQSESVKTTPSPYSIITRIEPQGRQLEQLVLIGPGRVPPACRCDPPAMPPRPPIRVARRVWAHAPETRPPAPAPDLLHGHRRLVPAPAP